MFKYGKVSFRFIVVVIVIVFRHFSLEIKKVNIHLSTFSEVKVIESFLNRRVIFLKEILSGESFLLIVFEPESHFR